MTPPDLTEYKIICGDLADCQKWLNQWRHEFTLNIISMIAATSRNYNEVIILLTRTKKS